MVMAMDNDRNKLLLEKFHTFCEENPLEFQEEQLKKIEDDIIKPRNGVVSDEYVDFILWTKGLKTRQEYFAEYVEKLFPQETYHKLLEVGCGRTARLSKLLATKGYQMWAMDPKVDPQVVSESAEVHNVSCRKARFTFEKTDITEFDGIVAQEPCEATEHIIRECVAKKKDFVISLCGVEHRLMNGEMPEDVFAWYHYLEEIGGDNCTLVRPKLIPGIMSHVMIGMFS